MITNHVKIKESKKQPFQIYVPVKLVDGRMSMKKEKKSSYVIYNNASLGKMAGISFS